MPTRCSIQTSRTICLRHISNAATCYCNMFHRFLTHEDTDWSIELVSFVNSSGSRPASEKFYRKFLEWCTPVPETLFVGSVLKEKKKKKPKPILKKSHVIYSFIWMTLVCNGNSSRHFQIFLLSPAHFSNEKGKKKKKPSKGEKNFSALKKKISFFRPHLFFLLLPTSV